MSKIASIRFSDILPLAWGSIRRNRLRSGLTIGAIGVGIALVVYLISLGFGLEALTLGNVQKSASLLSLTVETASKDLNPLDATAIKKITSTQGISKILPRTTLKGQVSLDKQLANTTIIGVDPDYLQITDATQLLVGRYYRPDDTQTMVVTTGFLKLFGLDEKKTPLVLFSVNLDAQEYPGVKPLTDILVSGVVKADDSQVAYLPRMYLESAVPKPPAYEHVKVTVAGLDQIEPVRTTLITKGFKVSAAVDTVADIKNAFTWIRAVLAALGLIAIFIATIGMFNTLTISLLERTKEVGIMKALGVRNKDVGRIFLTEAILMGILGGIAGLTGAFLLQQITLFILSLLAAVSNGTVPVVFGNNIYLLLGSFVFAMLIAAVTGYYPARRATKLNPIDAIRHE
jgi:putative ABC transport system permease protein